jgi:predicted small metal-binding protein
MDEEKSLEIACQCGWHTAGAKADVVRETQEHVMKVHWVEVDEEDVLEMTTPVTSDAPLRGSRSGSEIKEGPP